MEFQSYGLTAACINEDTPNSSEFWNVWLTDIFASFHWCFVTSLWKQGISGYLLYNWISCKLLEGIYPISHKSCSTPSSPNWWNKSILMKHTISISQMFSGIASQQSVQPGVSLVNFAFGCQRTHPFRHFQGPFLVILLIVSQISSSFSQLCINPPHIESTKHHICYISDNRLAQQFS